MARRTHQIQIEAEYEDEASKGLSSLGKDLLSLDNLAGGLAVGGVAALGGVLVGIGASAANMSADIEDASASMQAQLGASEEAAEGFEDRMQRVFANNFGENFEDIAQAIVATEQNFARLDQTLSESAMQKATEDAIRLRDAFDVEVNDSLNAAAELMDKFGLSSDQAFDFITAGMQRGLNASGDFLDSIGEYSTQFAEGGADAGEFFSILETGLQGGMLGTDRAADMFKEFRLIVTEGSQESRDALANLGIDVDAVTQKIQSGEMSWTDLFQLVLTKLAEVEDPQERFRLGVELMGTQFEDMGDSAALALDTTKIKIEDVEGATESLDEQYDTLRSNWEQATRDMRLALVPIGDGILWIGTKALPVMTEGIEHATGFVQGMIDGWSQVFDVVGNVINRIRNMPSLPSFGLPGFQSGTLNAPGGLALVGERGPEMVNLPRGSQVLSADETRAMLVQGNGHSQPTSITIHVEGNATPDTVMSALRMAGMAV